MVQSFPVYLISSTKGVNNTPASFTIRYPKKFEFNSSWSVGLTSIIYPHSWHDIGTDSEQYIDVTWNDGNLTRVGIKNSAHKTVEHLVNSLNQSILSASNGLCSEPPTSGKRKNKSSLQAVPKRAKRHGFDIGDSEKLKERIRELKRQGLEADRRKNKELKELTSKLSDLETSKRTIEEEGQRKISLLQQKIEELEKERKNSESKLQTTTQITAEVEMLRQEKNTLVSQNKNAVADLQKRLNELENEKLIQVRTKEKKISLLERELKKIEDEKLDSDNRSQVRMSHLQNQIDKLENDQKAGDTTHKKEIADLKNQLKNHVDTKTIETSQTTQLVESLRSQVKQLEKEKTFKEAEENELRQQLAELTKRSEADEFEKVKQINILLEKIQKLESANEIKRTQIQGEMDKFKHELELAEREKAAENKRNAEEILLLKQEVEKLNSEKRASDQSHKDLVSELKNEILTLKAAQTQATIAATDKLSTELSEALDLVADYEKKLKEMEAMLLEPFNEYSNTAEPISDIPISVELCETQGSARLADCINFSLDTSSGHVQLTINKNHVRTVQMSLQLEYVLGFEHTSYDAEISKARYIPDLYGGIHTLYIYAPSLVEPSLVGDSAVPLLDIVTVKGSPGEIVQETFNTPQLHKVLEKQVGEIIIEIRTSTGRLVPFNWGETTLVLNFKKHAVF